MSYSQEIEGLVAYKHKLEAENAQLRAAIEKLQGAVDAERERCAKIAAWGNGHPAGCCLKMARMIRDPNIERN